MQNRDAPNAQQALDRAIELGPNDAYVLRQYARFAAQVGNYAEAVNLATRAVALEGNGIILADMLILAGEYDRATAVYEKVLVRDSANFIARFNLSRLASRRGDREEAIGHLQIVEQTLRSYSGSFIVVYAYGLAGSRADAVRLFNLAEPVAAAEPHVSQTLWAMAYLGLGRNDEALASLKIAAADPSEDLGNAETTFIRINAFADPVLERPEFAEVRRGFAFTGVEEIN
jgi:tetratricopeptide (TPR) repeat protein